MFNKATKITVIVIFFLITAAATLFSDFEGGKVSEAQNRTLASFPDVKSDDMTFEKFTDEFENWCNDNVGFQNEYNKLYTRFNTSLNIPTNDRVHFGKDGFYFYTVANSVRIATGEHIISDEKLQLIAENQQEISDYYKKNGKEYYLVLVPSKASVYPEKIRGGNFEVTETTVDKIEKYLIENTDVKVINVKNALLESKEQGNLVYMKTDTHWSVDGAYVAYNAIMDRMISDGIIEYKADFSPEFSISNTAQGDLSKMIGENALAPEKISVANWQKNFEYDDKSEKYTAISNTLTLLDKTTNVEIARNEKRYVNPTDGINPQVLQIYGDSLYLDPTQINQFFAENFKTVQYLRVRSVCQSLDEAVEPNIVIFSVFERYAENLLSAPPQLTPDISILDELKEISVEKPDVWIGNKGLYISATNKAHCSIEEKDIIFDEKFDSCDFTCWAFDYNQKTDLKELFIFADDELINFNYGLDGSDVGEHFNFESVKNCRFKFTLTKDFILYNNVTKLKFVMVSSDGIHKYEPIVYNIKFQ